MLSEAADFKEQMVETRRRQILMGAAQVFFEKGFHKATTKEIAQAAGVSEGTIYNYFSNKRDLLLGMVDMIAIRTLNQVFTAEPSADPRQLLTTIMHNRFEVAGEYGPLILPILAEVFTDVELRQALYQQIAMPVFSHLEQYVQANIDAGRFRDINPLIFTRAVAGTLIINFMLKLSELDTRYKDIPVETLIEQITSLFLEGIVAAPDDKS
jgi:AcrR family transcriptional regulator